MEPALIAAPYPLVPAAHTLSHTYSGLNTKTRGGENGLLLTTHNINVLMAMKVVLYIKL